jgi:hypothetical protein
MMLTTTLTMAAGEVREMALSGNYFELRTAAGLIEKIELLDRAGGVVSILEQADVTDYVRTSRNFETARFTNGATAQAIRFYNGDGDSGSNRFTGVVSGTVTLDAATLAALESTDLNQATINALVRPEAPTTTVTSITALGGSVSEQVLLPATNVSGVIVLSVGCSIYGGAIGTHGGGLYAKNSAVATYTDSALLAPLRMLAADGGNMVVGVDVQNPIFVPAGLGLYWFLGVSSGVGYQRTVRFKVL